MSAGTSGDLLEILRRSRRSAGDQRKIFLTLYGLLLLVVLAIVAVAAGRAALFGSPWAELGVTFLRPVQATAGFLAGAFDAGRWGLMAVVALSIWLLGMLVGSFFGLAVTRMAAVELTCERRAEKGEALRFARKHWHWGFLTPAGLLAGALLLLGLGSLLLSMGRITPWLLVIAVPCAFIVVIGAVVLILGLLAGGILAWPAIATEWSDAFDAVTRVYGYSFTHPYRVFLYRLGATAALVAAVVTRGFRSFLALGLLFLALVLGLGKDRTGSLLDSILLEQPQALPFPQTLAGWTLLACTAVFLTLVVARLLVFRLVLHQAVYLLLRRRIDKMPVDNIDGYRPDDSDYDPTAQGFQLMEVEEEIRAE